MKSLKLLSEEDFSRALLAVKNLDIDPDSFSGDSFSWEFDWMKSSSGLKIRSLSFENLPLSTKMSFGEDEREFSQFSHEQAEFLKQRVSCFIIWGTPLTSLQLLVWFMNKFTSKDLSQARHWMLLIRSLLLTKERGS